jgi:hypothetical protein
MKRKHWLWLVVGAVVLVGAWVLFRKKPGTVGSKTGAQAVPPPAPNQSGQVASAFNAGLSSAIGSGFNLLTGWATNALAPGASSGTPGPAPIGSSNSTGVSAGITGSTGFNLTDPFGLFN